MSLTRPRRTWYVDKLRGYTRRTGRDAGRGFATIAAALVVDGSKAFRGDRIEIASHPSGYDEALTINDPELRELELVGLGGPGQVFVKPAAANAIPLTIEGTAADRMHDVTLRNIGLESNGTGVALHVKGNIRRVRLIGCKIEGGTAAIKLESTAAGAVGDIQIIECELAWTATILHILVTGAGNAVTQVLLKDNLIHNFSSRGVFVDAVAAADLWMFGNRFGRQEAGTEPTNEYVKAFAGTTGSFAGNVIPAAAATAKLSLASIIAGANHFTDGFKQPG